MKREYPYIEGQLLYIAHPYGGDEANKERVQTYLKMLQEKYPEKTLFSPLQTGDIHRMTKSISISR